MSRWGAIHWVRRTARGGGTDRREWDTVIAFVFLITLLQDARALSTATDAALARGDYQSALQQAQAAYEAHERLCQHADAAWDLNAIGLANQYLGHYEAALAAYQRALALDRQAARVDGEIMRLNNIANIHFLQGRYSDALNYYEQALPRATKRQRTMTLSNMAALDQRLGADERALDLYRQVAEG